MSYRTIFSCIVIVKLCIFSDLSGQRLSIETVTDTNRITIGDQINLTYKIHKSKGLNLSIPSFSGDLSDGIEIIGSPHIDSTKTKNGEKVLSVKMKITAFDTGTYVIPAQPFVINERTYSDTVYSKASLLTVVGVALDTTGTIRDIKGPKALPYTFIDFLPYILAFLVLVIIGLAILLFFRRQKIDVSGFKPVKSNEPPHITAFRELDKIKAQKLWQQKQVKEYYSRITYVIRWYISKRFAINALELTSYEILSHLKSLNLDQVNFGILENLLNLADMVKFAKGEPDPDENVTRLEQAYDFVKMTKLDQTHPENKPNEDQKNE